MALKLGLSYLPIASELIETLFKWQKELPLNTLLPLLLEIVPLFDRFLHSQGDFSHVVALKPKRKPLRLFFSIFLSLLFGLNCC